MTATSTLDPGVTDPGRDDTPRAGGDAELVVATLALVSVAAMGLWFTVHPGPTFFDTWALAVVPHVHHSGSLLALTRLGSPFVVGVGAVVGFLATVRRDAPRALALLVGPVLAVVLGDTVVKPVVGRTFSDVVSFPSGTVTALAALAAVGALAAPGRWRFVAGAVGGAVAAATAVAVVALRWHYPTDALAGLAGGAGVVLAADDCARRLAARLRTATARDALKR